VSLPTGGFVAPGYEPVREAFESALRVGAGTGAAVAAWHDGRWLVDLWGGYADAARTRPWSADSLAMPYSATKPFAAVCVLCLVEQGRLELDRPVSHYWPEFRAPATVRHLLAHQAGIVSVDEPLPTEALLDHDRLCAALAQQGPRWTPGEAHGEAALVYGHLLGEVVRRVDGRTLGRFLRDEITEPNGIEFHVGLRDGEFGRAVELTGFELDFEAEMAGYAPLLREAMANPPGALDPVVVNSEPWRRAEIAAVNGHGTARGLAGLYVALMDGGLLSDALLGEMRRPHAVGPDRVLGGEAAWGLGVAVDDDGFGMGGLGGSFGWWSERGRYAFGWLTGWVGSGDAGDRIERAFRDVLGLPGD
jgi:CubicO group peptidase (beta-lactamase class C family)